MLMVSQRTRLEPKEGIIMRVSLLDSKISSELFYLRWQTRGMIRLVVVVVVVVDISGIVVVIYATCGSPIGDL